MDNRIGPRLHAERSTNLTASYTGQMAQAEKRI